MKKKRFLAGLLSCILLLGTGCGGAKKEELKSLKGVPAFYETRWGMDKEAVLAALGCKEAEFTRQDNAELILLEKEDYNWEGKAAQLTLGFSDMELSDGKKAGLSAVTVTMDADAITAEETVKLLEETGKVEKGLLKNSSLEGEKLEFGFTLGNQSVPDYNARAVAAELVKALGYKEKQAQLSVRMIFNMTVTQTDGKVQLVYYAPNAAIAAHCAN